MKEIKVFVADDNIVLAKELCEFINTQEDMKIVGVAYDGKDCLNSFSLLEADILILDDIIPSIDGLSVLRILNKMSSKIPNVILISSLYSDYVKKRAFELGAFKVISKPLDKWELVTLIRKKLIKNKTELTNKLSPPLETKIKLTLYYLGVPSTLKGFQYL